MRATKRQTEAVRAYVEDQSHETVVHLEKAASELVGPVRHDIWDVHCTDSRWWVITEPTNYYSQQDFNSRNVALTFHIASPFMRGCAVWLWCRTGRHRGG